MATGLAGARVTLLGGDGRERALVSELLDRGAVVVAFGHLPGSLPGGCIYVNSPERALVGADGIVGTMGGVELGQVIKTLDSCQAVLSPQLLELVPDGAPFLVGMAGPRLREFCRRRPVHLIQVADLDDVAIDNSVPTAEGAIHIAMQELPITLHSSNAFVVGLGRVGMTLTRSLLGLGARVTVAVRNPAQLARAREMGARALPLAELQGAVGAADVVFNTVPALVLDGKVIAAMRPGTLVVDLASSPGGTDFGAAERHGVRAMLAPGLPAKVAPETAGRIVARAVPEVLGRVLAARAEQPAAGVHRTEGGVAQR